MRGGQAILAGRSGSRLSSGRGSGRREGRQPVVPAPWRFGYRSATRGRARLLLVLYGVAFAPEVVAQLGLVRSGHGGAEVGKMAWRGWAQRGWGCGQAWAASVGGRSCEELTAALTPPRLLGRRFNFFIQQKCGFRKAPRKVEPRRSDTGTSGEAYKRSALIPPVEETVFYPSPYPIRSLIKPLFFTVGFTGCAFGSAAIWQYESLKSRVQSYFDGIKADWLDSIRPQKEGDFRKEINKWWNNLSDGQRTVTGIIAANVLVFCLWRVPSLQRTMIRYFTSNPASSVISNFVSYVGKVATGRYGPSLGASGAIMTVLAAVCTKIPEGRLAIIFLPMFTFTAGNALKAIIAMDTAGMILGWKFFDHAAHLGGALFGILSCPPLPCLVSHPATPTSVSPVLRRHAELAEPLLCMTGVEAGDCEPMWTT
ncbi:presenilin-associated rhomboid-like protein, mitochondrial isoform X3 [Pongo pygmaeus]|uniref:presenilin-associated rhomboid-like protein, mitochondrial isoform X3 n=1 Tax=Pongo pygmaeus TaxID=9600 RepID=UPI00300C7EFE